jgi:hypothetical protein
MTMINTTETVAFLDLAAVHAPLRDELTAAWNQALTSSAFVGGEAVAGFEKQWADYCGTAHCVPPMPRRARRKAANRSDHGKVRRASQQIGPGHRPDAKRGLADNDERPERHPGNP